MSQNKFYKLWEICGKWEKIVPIRGHSFWSIQLQSRPVATSLQWSLSFLQFKKTRPFMFWIQGQPDQFDNWAIVQASPVASLLISCQLDFETLCSMLWFEMSWNKHTSCYVKETLWLNKGNNSSSLTEVLTKRWNVLKGILGKIKAGWDLRTREDLDTTRLLVLHRISVKREVH